MVESEFMILLFDKLNGKNFHLINLAYLFKKGLVKF